MGKGCILVTGGAGYIGSHVALALLESGWRRWWSSIRWPPACAGWSRRRRRSSAAMPATPNWSPACCCPTAARAVMHFAGSTVVPESLGDPLKYYLNNSAASRTLIAACLAAGIERFIFSSTAALYGNPHHLPVTEEAPPRPLSPYGTSKLVTEWMLRDVAAAIAAALRGAALFQRCRGRSQGPQRPVHAPTPPTWSRSLAKRRWGKRPSITIHGTDYPTPDGTCVRDFIHVTDLAAAHVAALGHLMAGGTSQVLNCGYGRGVSVREIIEAARRLSGRPIQVVAGPRRPGDIVAMVADNARIRRVLRWQPQWADTDAIVGSALAWEHRI